MPAFSEEFGQASQEGVFVIDQEDPGFFGVGVVHGVGVVPIVGGPGSKTGQREMVFVS